MGSTFRSIDVVYEGINIFRIGIIMLHRYFDKNMLLFPFTINNIRVKCFFSLV